VSSKPQCSYCGVLSAATSDATEVQWWAFPPNRYLRSVGLSSTPGTHILFADDNGNLGLQVASAKEVNVVNTQNVTEGVCLTFMW
jgi:hypothetical protein